MTLSHLCQYQWLHRNHPGRSRSCVITEVSRCDLSNHGSQSVGDGHSHFFEMPLRTAGPVVSVLTRTDPTATRSLPSERAATLTPNRLSSAAGDSHSDRYVYPAPRIGTSRSGRPPGRSSQVKPRRQTFGRRHLRTARTTHATTLTWVSLPLIGRLGSPRALLRLLHAPYRSTEGGSGGSTPPERIQD